MKALLFDTEDWQSGRMVEVVPANDYFVNMLGNHIRTVPFENGVMALVGDKSTHASPVLNRLLIHTSHPMSRDEFLTGPALVLGTDGGSWADVPEEFLSVCQQAGVEIS